MLEPHALQHREHARLAPRGAARRPRRARRATFSSTVRRGSSLKSWNTTPMRRRSAGTPDAPSAATLRPSTRIWPSLGRSAANTSRISVVLPAPHGPVRNANSPLRSSSAHVAQRPGAGEVRLRDVEEADERVAAARRVRPERVHRVPPEPRLTSRGACAAARSRRGSRGSPRRAGRSERAAPSTVVLAGGGLAQRGGVRVRRLERAPRRSGRRARGHGSPSAKHVGAEPLADLVVEAGRTRGCAARPGAASPSARCTTCRQVVGVELIGVARSSPKR